VTSPETPEAQNNPHHDEREHPAWKWLRRVGVFAGIAYAIITWFMYCANRDAANAATNAAGAARSAATTAADQLELEERPWVDATITIDGPFEFNVNGVNAHLKFTLKNTGKSPAQSVDVNPILLIGGKIGNASGYRDQACKDAARVSNRLPQFGMVLFPNIPFEQQYSFGIGKEEIEQDKASKQFPASKFGEVILSPVAVVCMAYRSTFNKTSTYHTAYIVDFYKRTPLGPSPIFKIGENVDPKQLLIRLHPLDAISADRARHARNNLHWTNPRQTGRRNSASSLSYCETAKR